MKKKMPINPVANIHILANIRSRNPSVKALLEDPSPTREEEARVYEYIVKDTTDKLIKKYDVTAEDAEKLVRENFAHYSKQGVVLLLAPKVYIIGIPYWLFFSLIALGVMILELPIIPSAYNIYAITGLIITYLICAAYYCLNHYKIYENRIQEILKNGKI